MGNTGTRVSHGRRKDSLDSLDVDLLGEPSALEGERSGNGEAPRAWRAYEGHEHPVLGTVAAVRWAILAASGPLHKRALPWYRCTWGEVLLVTAVIGCTCLVAVSSTPSGVGGVATFPLVMTFATISKKSLWSFVLGLPFERALAYHKLFALLSVAVGGYHGYRMSHLSWRDSDRVDGGCEDDHAEKDLGLARHARQTQLATNATNASAPAPAWTHQHRAANTTSTAYTSSYTSTATLPPSSQYGHVHQHPDADGDDDDDAGMCLTGFILFVIMAALIVTSFEPVRRRLYNTFLAVHLTLFCGTVVMCLLHDASIVLLGFGLYVMDAAVRYAIAAANNPRQVELLRISDTVVRIRFPKAKGSLDYRAGQYMFVCVPSLSVFEWHPFSISSSPHDTMTTIHVRAGGDWTRALHAMASSQQDNAGGCGPSPGSLDGTVTVPAFLDGCYGEPAVDIDGDRYNAFLVLAGGAFGHPELCFCPCDGCGVRSARAVHVLFARARGLR